MLKNHLLTAIRNLKRNKLFSLINFIGLSLGIAASFIVFTYVFNQKDYDQFHSAKDRIVRLINEKQTVTGIEQGLNTVPALAYYGKDHISGVEDCVLFNSYDYVNNSLSYSSPDGEVTSFREEKVYFTTGSFFSNFDFDVLAGDPAKSFEEPNQLVLTQSIAQKYFPDQEAVGKTILVKNIHGDFEYQVAGVIADLPFNTHLDANVLLSFPGLHQLVGDESYQWNWSTVMTYLVLEPDADKQRITKQLAKAFNQNLQSQNTYSFSFQSLADIYLNSSLDGEFKQNGNPLAIRAFTIVAVLLLIIAWVNYINLSSIKAAERYREIGIRKALGSSRQQIITQFLLETTIFNLVAVLLAILLTYFLLPVISAVLAQPLSLTIWLHPQMLIGAFMVFISGTILSGFYAAFIISGYQPIKALSKSLAPSQGSLLRKGLVVFQFLLSIVLVSGVLVVYNQVNFMQNKALGINLDDILVINAPPISFNNSEGMQKKNTFKQEILQLSSVSYVSTSSKVPGIPINWTGTIKPDQKSKQSTACKMIAMDMDYPKLYDFSISAGRFYRERDNTFTTGEVLVNQKVLQFLGIEDEEMAIGQTFSSPIGDNPLKIIGVVNDYHHLTLKEEIPPMLYVYSVWSNYYSVKLNVPPALSDTDKVAVTKRAIQDIEDCYENVFGKATAFDYFFQDQQFNQQYKAEIKFASMFGMFSSLAILVALLGLFALSYYYSLRKTREIGIRKVLGASVTQIVLMLNRIILYPLLLAAVLALPLAYWVGNEWLQSYAYRINLNAFHLFIPVVVVLLISLFVVSLQTFRSASVNPVNALRNE